GSACFARGNAQNLEYIENYLKENDLDAKIEIAGSRCEGKCAEGPNIVVDGIEYNGVNEEKIKSILEKLVQV
ncbi:(2Fe-2S) ferredoxin domain-containing protein, partial [Citrobacter freundii]|uniref:(2Fe-2S) ferredoxin domain-containing protein n=1 Tax=Citrobacter freundii TaxID=546 RepID=UPI0038C23668